MIFLRKFFLSFLLISCLNISLQAMLKSSMPAKTSQTFSTQAAKSKFSQFVSSLWSGSSATETSVVNKQNLVDDSSPSSLALDPKTKEMREWYMALQENPSLDVNYSDLSQWMRVLNRKLVTEEDVKNAYEDKEEFESLLSENLDLKEKITNLKNKLASSTKGRKSIKLELKKAVQELIENGKKMEEHRKIVEQRRIKLLSKDYPTIDRNYQEIHNTYAWHSGEVKKLKNELAELDVQAEQDKNKTEVSSAEMEK